MRAFLKDMFSAKVQAFNPDHSFLVSGVMRWRLCRFIAGLPGVTFTRKPRLFGSGALPYAEFRFRELMFQVDDGGDWWGWPLDYPEGWAFTSGRVAGDSRASGEIPFAAMSLMPIKPQGTPTGRRGCNRRVSSPPSLSMGG